MGKKIEVKNYTDFLLNLFLFQELPQNKIQEVLSAIDTQIFEFEANESIYSPNDFKQNVGFVICGECSVEKQKPDGTTIPLNKLTKGDSFGILAVFSKKKQFPTIIKASKRSRVMFFGKETIISLAQEYPEIALAIISFMSDRIEFLNTKIATFSADSVEEKFAFYILNEYRRTGSISFPMNLSKTAKTLNAGRASVYRAIESLEKLSLIKFENKKIYIADPDGLERISK